MTTRLLNSVLCSLVALVGFAQPKNFFVDGFHGGLYGHYPLDTYTQFMVDQLEAHPDWYIGLEIEQHRRDKAVSRDLIHHHTYGVVLHLSFMLNISHHILYHLL